MALDGDLARSIVGPQYESNMQAAALIEFMLTVFLTVFTALIDTLRLESQWTRRLANAATLRLLITMGTEGFVPGGLGRTDVSMNPMIGLAWFLYDDSHTAKTFEEKQAYLNAFVVAPVVGALVGSSLVRLSSVFFGGAKEKSS